MYAIKTYCSLSDLVVKHCVYCYAKSCYHILSNVLHTFSRSVITLLLDKMYEALLSVTPLDIVLLHFN